MLLGIAAAPGTGTAVHAFDETGITGRVLVCDVLGPEAVPALLTAPAGVVATTGGELSHTAIITRELGIPCVTNITNARTAITPGTVVEVDGGAGTVRPASGGAVPAQHSTRQARPLTATAVLTHPLEHPDPDDGRAATLLWFDADDPTTSARGGASGPHPVGVLVPGDLPVPVTVEAGCRAIHLPGLGTLLWPQGAPPPPAALGPDGQVLHRRTVAR
ncbi:PEP-utilizing enzyme [Kitasatospora sp. NPDC058201]|uniref:PEP-utilizing enzyme n=1 Tax=unclassified Kitasatospora TaxID=2633591 RepID=UPI00365F318E